MDEIQEALAVIAKASIALDKLEAESTAEQRETIEAMRDRLEKIRQILESHDER